MSLGTSTRPRGCEHARRVAVICAGIRFVSMNGRPSCRHCGRGSHERWGGRCWCDRRAGPGRSRRWRRGIVCCQSPPCAAISIVGVVVATTSTISTSCAVCAIEAAARSSSVGGVARDAFVAVVTSTTRRVVRFCVGGGTALGFKLMSLRRGSCRLRHGQRSIVHVPCAWGRGHPHRRRRTLLGQMR